MGQNIRFNKAIKEFPDEWSEDLIPKIIQILKDESFRLAVIDDDPAGTQTVSDVTIMNKWNCKSVLQEFNELNKVLFFNTNHRTLNQKDAQKIIKNTIELIEEISDLLSGNIEILYRFDSTLRGHFKVIVESHLKQTKNKLNGILFIPYFFEGRRYTIDNIQYVSEFDSNKNQEI